MLDIVYLSLVNRTVGGQCLLSVCMHTDRAASTDGDAVGHASGFPCIASIPKNHFLHNRGFRGIFVADQKLARAENARKCHKLRGPVGARAGGQLTGRRADAIQGV